MSSLRIREIRRNEKRGNGGAEEAGSWTVKSVRAPSLSRLSFSGALGEKTERLKVRNGRRRQESLEGKRRRPFALSRSQKKFVFLRSDSTGRTFSDLSALE